jgi:hypothetical protein
MTFLDIFLYFSYFSKALNKTDVFQINAIVLDSSPVELLIGKQTIRTTQIFYSVPSQLSSHSVTATSVAAISEIAELAILSYCWRAIAPSVALPRLTDAPMPAAYTFVQVK